jgi:hypothetical protein
MTSVIAVERAVAKAGDGSTSPPHDSSITK